MTRDGGAGLAEADGIDERTVVVRRDDVVVEERTVVVVREQPGGPSADWSDSADARADVDVDEFDRTVVVGRADADADAEVDEFDRTVVVGRADADADRTVVVRRSGDAGGADGPATDADDEEDEDRTVVTGRSAGRQGGRKGATTGTSSGADSDPRASREASAAAPPGKSATRRSAGGRRALTPAPLDPATLRPARPGAGAGAVDPYAPRPVPRHAVFPPQVPADEAPTRDTAVARPSLARASRRGAGVSLVLVAGTTVVAAGGLVALAVLAISWL
ncbi:hypothetical protein ACGGZK_00600 [Agromyces sp. MMS24-K17]|uniref:hypothetical protein n=1 Tax=Agromyces sp. MMS24-K17 TaxID=3372850 RepID=UPI0037549D18